jgi:hypothetical protein
MPFLKKSDVRQIGRNHINRRAFATAKSIATESEQYFTPSKKYDVFLSHSSKDAELVVGVKVWLEEQGNTVYVDWLDDAEVDRSKVTTENANMLKTRMKACSSMIFIATENSAASKWVPWELGYFDGLKEDRVAVLPVLEDWQTSFDGQEYLGLYPVIEQTTINYVPRNVVRRKNLTHASMDQFTRGTPYFS